MVSLAGATHRALAALAEMGMKPEFIDLGQGGVPTAWLCRILAEDGTMPAMAQGMGKGWPEEARVGALFEALEHYLTGPAMFDPVIVELAECTKVAAGPMRGEACAVLLAQTPGQWLACHHYRRLGGGPGILVPLSLSAPWYVETHAGQLREQVGDTYDYGQLMRYSCNSGSAIGVTLAEALLHALNEVIERDAFSLLLVRSFLPTDDFRLTLIDPDTLSEELAHAYVAVVRLTRSPVYLLDITSDLGVPTMLAYVAPTLNHPHRRGVGTSFSPVYAAWRALTELLQTTLGETVSPSHVPHHGELAGLAEHPVLHRCGRFDLTDQLPGALMIPFPWSDEAPGHPFSQLRKLAAILAMRGYTPFYRSVAALPGEITVVHAIVPGLERFMLITDGNLVLPGRRGQAIA